MSRYADEVLPYDLCFVMGMNTSEIHKVSHLCSGSIGYASQGAVVFFKEVIEVFLREAGPYLPDNSDWFFSDWAIFVSDDFSADYFISSCSVSDFFKKESLLLLLDTNFYNVFLEADFQSKEDEAAFKRAWVTTHQLFNVGD